MRATRQVTTVLLAAALAATGCSKREEVSSSKGETMRSGQLRPVSTSGEVIGTKPVDAGIGKPAVTEVATFGDAKAAFEATKYSDATVMFESYTVRQPKNAWGHYMLGLSAWRSGDAVKAEGAFEKALRIDPKHVKSYVNLSRLFIEQKRYDEAAARLTRAAAVEPGSIEVQRLLGRVYQDQGKTSDAIDAYRRAIELDEFDAWSMNNLGLLLLDEKRVDEALPLFEKAVEIKKRVPAFHNNLGMALEHAGRFKDAATAYANALAVSPGYEKAKSNLERVSAVKEQ